MTSVPHDMTAIEIAEPGAPDVLRPVRRAVPQPGFGEVLVKVAAAGVNRPDVMQRQGGYPPPPGASDIPGLEIAGEVVSVGPGVDELQPGAQVMALVTGGGYAEYCLAAADICLRVPDGLDMVAAAAIPETFFTVWTNVFDRGNLIGGETFLIHGGSSGIGTTAIQLADRRGARVFATAGSDDKCAACAELGAERAINYRTEDFVAVAKQLTDGRGVDLIVDMVGGSYIQRNLDALAVEGRLVQIAFLESPQQTLNLLPMMLKRLTITGSTLRPRTVEQKAEIAAALRTEVLPLVAAGRIKPIIDSTFALADAAGAHRRMESSSHIGKIILTP